VGTAAATAGARRHPGQQAVKWTTDRVLAAALLVLLSPLLAVLSAWIRLEAGRPVLFVQRRVGKGGREFRMLKFRTMVNDAVRVGAQLGLSEDPFAVLRDDPRVTRSGRFLRRTSLDELPQLVNVLAGQMSLVGPRPDIPEQVRHYTDEERRRLEVRPGITGLAQVQGRDEIDWPERIVLDIQYIESWTLALDVRLMLRTLTQLRREESDPAVDVRAVERARRERLHAGGTPADPPS